MGQSSAKQGYGTYTCHSCRSLTVAVVHETCREWLGLTYGTFVRPFAATTVGAEVPVYDAKHLVSEYLQSLDQGASSDTLSDHVTHGIV